uniref:Bryohealin n=1 Tax=Bryopsis plumosa TaxID=3130 RepID=B3VLC2_BRYPL|nr:bryohealin precursor [Bryopsis plumosa]
MAIKALHVVIAVLAAFASHVGASDLPTCDFFHIPEGYLEASNGGAGNIKCKNWGSLEEAKSECLSTKGCDGFSFGGSGGAFSGCLKKNRAAGYNGNANYGGYHKNVMGCCGGESYSLQNGGSCSQTIATEQLVSQGKPAKQASLDFGGEASRGVDGDDNPMWSGNSCTHTEKQQNPWWQVDLGGTYQISKVVITNREDCCWDRLHNFEIRIGSENNSNLNAACISGQSLGKGETKSFSCPMVGRHVNIKIFDVEYLTLCEVKVYAMVAGASPTYRMLA